MESVNDMWYKLCTVIEFCDAKKESVRNIHKCLCNAYGSAEVNRITVSQWVKRMMASEMVEAEL